MMMIDETGNILEKKEVSELEEEGGTDLMEVEGFTDGVETDLEEKKNEKDDLSNKILTGKMKYLMKEISEYGYLTMPEVELVYGNQSHAYRVLGTLKSKGLVGDFETELLPKKAYFLRPKGYRTLENFGELRVKRRFLAQGFKPFIFKHRMACAKVGLILKEHPLVREFLPESLLWERAVQRRQKLCDGEFIYRAPDAKPERVGLEVELTLKNRDKLDESLRQLKDRRDLAQVWWVCGSPTILRALKSEVMRRYWSSTPRHLFCLMDDFLALKHQTRLTDAEGREFKIDPAEPTLRPMPPPTPLQAARPQPEPLPLARAEVPPQPQPAPRLVPDWERYRDDRPKPQLSLIDHLLDVGQVVVPAVCLTVLFAAVGWMLWTKIGPSRAPAPAPERPWLARKILNASDLRSAAGTWAIKRLALRSRGDNFSLSLRLTNVRPNWCGLTDVRIMDAERKILMQRHQRGGAWIWPQKSWEDGFSFKTPRTATRLLLQIVSDGWDCSGMELPLDFK